jgi:deoxyadenosine/deoxycytidine kinase
MHIAVSGNIGSGKTTLAHKLAKHFGWQVEIESVENNPYLADFYNDMPKWSFHLQVFFLNSRFNQVKKINACDITTIQDRTIYEDAYIFASNLHESGFMNDRDYASYLALFESMIQHVTPPDLLIYLDADIPRLIERIEKRGRDFENAIRIDYLKNLNEKYRNWINGYDLGKKLILDGNTLDFVKRQEDFSSIVNRVDAELYGLFS